MISYEASVFPLSLEKFECMSVQIYMYWYTQCKAKKIGLINLSVRGREYQNTSFGDNFVGIAAILWFLSILLILLMQETRSLQ